VVGSSKRNRDDASDIEHDERDDDEDAGDSRARQPDAIVDTMGNRIVLRKRPQVCRIASISFSNAELYCMRMLLLRFPAYGFDELLAGSATFKDRAMSLGLITDERETTMAMLDLLFHGGVSYNEWLLAMNQFSTHLLTRLATAAEVQQFFIVLARNCPGGAQLFEMFWPFMVGNRVPDRSALDYDLDPFKTKVLMELDDRMRKDGLTIADLGLDPIDRHETMLDLEVARFPPEALAADLAVADILSDEQRAFAQEIDTAAAEIGAGKLFYLSGDGGAGKTTVLKYIAAVARSKKRIVLPIAFMAITASLYSGGDTAHRTFGLPLVEGDDFAGCGTTLDPTSAKGERIRLARIIILDEVGMLHEQYERMIDEACRLCDPANAHLPFAGKTVIFVGDWKQIPPVIMNGCRTAIVSASIRSKPTFHNVFHRHLPGSKRLTDERYALWAKSLGVGRFPGCTEVDGPFVVDLRKSGARVTSNFDDDVLPFILRDPAKCLMVAFTNRVVHERNRCIFEAHAAQSGSPRYAYLAADTMLDTADHPIITPDLISKSEKLSDSVLRVFVGSIVTCLRNLMPSAGLQNGTRIRITRHSRYRIEGVIVEHPIHSGKRVSIPRIKMEGSFIHGAKFSRLQFPLTLGYCMTSNKVQGQTVSSLVLDATEDSFTHGQLYTAVTRVRKAADLLVYDANGAYQITSVIYRELLMPSDDVFNADAADDILGLT